MKNKFYIYLIEDHRNKAYIGMTSKTPVDRFQRHKQNAKLGIETHLYRAMRKYGYNNFEVIPLDSASSKEEALNLEKDWISSLGTYKDWGYNCTPGGVGAPLGEEHPMYGKSREFSEDHIKEISKSQTGESHNHAKLTNKEVKEIKWLLNNTHKKQKIISEKYSMHEDSISMINQGENWSHINQEIKPDNYQPSKKARAKWVYLNSRLNQSEVADLYNVSKPAICKWSKNDSIIQKKP